MCDNEINLYMCTFVFAIENNIIVGPEIIKYINNIIFVKKKMNYG